MTKTLRWIAHNYIITANLAYYGIAVSKFNRSIKDPISVLESSY